MAKENKIEYERVDEENDNYRRILVKFNPHFLRKADIEIEFIPIIKAQSLGEDFVSRIDSFSTIDLYIWECRHGSIAHGYGSDKVGTIPPIKGNRKYAEDHVKLLRMGELELEPRQIVSRVKEQYRVVEEATNPPIAFLWNYFLFSGRLGSFPPTNELFTIENLKAWIEEFSYRSRNRDGREIERPLAEHLLDTHETKYIRDAIILFFAHMNKKMDELLAKVKQDMRKE